MKKSIKTPPNQIGLAALVTAALLLSVTVQAADSDVLLKNAVDQQARVLMNEHDIPGMAFGVIIDGQSHLYQCA